MSDCRYFFSLPAEELLDRALEPLVDLLVRHRHAQLLRLLLELDLLHEVLESVLLDRLVLLGAGRRELLALRLEPVRRL